VQKVGTAAGIHERGLIHTETIFAKPGNWPAQITWCAKGAVYSNGTGVGYVRLGATHRHRGGRWQVRIARKGHPPETDPFDNHDDAVKWA